MTTAFRVLNGLGQPIAPGRKIKNFTTNQLYRYEELSSPPTPTRPARILVTPWELPDDTQELAAFEFALTVLPDGAPLPEL